MNNNSHPQIFQAFDALVGFKKVLKSKEKVKVDKIILSEEDLQELNLKSRQLKVGMMVSIIYYQNGDYLKKTGRIAKLNFDTKIIQIVKEKISFNNILDIQFEDD